MQTLTAILLFSVTSLLWTPVSDKIVVTWKDRLASCLHGVWTSFLVLICSGLFLGIMSVFSIPLWILLTLAVTSLKIIWKIPRRDQLGLEHLASFSFPAVLFFFTWIAPEPGHWIAGGWDPGIYMNQGVAMSRTGSLYPDDQWFHDSIPEEYQRSFLRIFNTRHERFPGVVIHDSRISYQFSRLFPTAIGLFAELGGVELASRTNYWIGLLCLATAAGWGAMISVKAMILFPVLLAAQPIFTYHTHLPVTEMLELGLVLWAGMIFFQFRTSSGDVVRIAFALFCAILNRFSMVPFSGLFFLTACVLLRSIDLSSIKRIQILTAYLLSTLMGLALSFVISPVSIRGWSVTPVLIQVFVWSTLLGTILLFLPLPKTFRPKFHVFVDRAITFALPLMILSLLAFFWFRGQQAHQFPYLQRLIPFVGIGWAILFLPACLSTGILRQYSPGAKMFTLFIISVCILMMHDPQITAWYPWALRRYLSFTLPMILLVILFLVESLSRINAPKGLRLGLAPFLLLAAFLASGKTFMEGLRLRDYRGLEPILHSVSNELPDDAIVISDDPRWGTPLHLIYGKKILCGRGLWQREDPKEFEEILVMLSELPKVYFLTSLASEMSIYPEIPSEISVERVISLDPITVSTIIQHPRAARFVLQPMTRVFTIHKLSTHRETGREIPPPTSPQIPGL